MTTRYSMQEQADFVSAANVSAPVILKKKYLDIQWTHAEDSSQIGLLTGFDVAIHTSVDPADSSSYLMPIQRIFDPAERRLVQSVFVFSTTNVRASVRSVYANGMVSSWRSLPGPTVVSPVNIEVSRADLANVPLSAVSGSQVGKYVQSRGMNMVANGMCNLESNYNFAGVGGSASFIYDATEAYAGAGSFRHDTVGESIFSDELIPVDPGKFYEMRFWLKTKGTIPADGSVFTHYAGGVFYDSDFNIMWPNTHMRLAGTDTTLAADLNNGDTVIHLTSAANWFDDVAGMGSWRNQDRSIIIFGYTNSKGYTYPDYTYSQHTFFDMWNDGAINHTTNTITLRSPWTGGHFAAGTACSDASAGGSFKYFAYAFTTYDAAKDHPADWREYKGTIGGIDLSGTNDTYKFPPGAAFMKLLFLPNYYYQFSGPATPASIPKYHYSSIWFSEANASQITGVRDAKVWHDTYVNGDTIATNLANKSIPGNLTIGNDLTVNSQANFLNRASIVGEGATVNFIGTTHSYFQWYPQGIAAGRKAYFGFPGSGSNDLSFANEADGHMHFSAPRDVNLNPGGGFDAKVGGSILWRDANTDGKVTNAKIASGANISKAKIDPGGLWAETEIPALTVAKIPDLSAAKITSGTFAAARIGDDTINANHLDNTNGFGLTVAARTVVSAGYTLLTSTSVTLPFDSVKIDTVGGYSGSSSQYTPAYKGIYEVRGDFSVVPGAANVTLSIDIFYGLTSIAKLEHKFTNTNKVSLSLSALINVDDLSKNILIKASEESGAGSVTFSSSTRCGLCITRIGING